VWPYRRAGEILAAEQIDATGGRNGRVRIIGKTAHRECTAEGECAKSFIGTESRF